MTGQMVKLPPDEDTPEKVATNVSGAISPPLISLVPESGQDLQEHGQRQGCEANI